MDVLKIPIYRRDGHGFHIIEYVFLNLSHVIYIVLINDTEYCELWLSNGERLISLKERFGLQNEE